MIFNEENADFLSNQMCLNISDFEAYLSARFGSETQCFNELVCFLLQDKAREILPQLDVMNQSIEFDDLIERAFDRIRSVYVINEDQEDYLYEIMCYFGWFFSGGLAELFKHRQAENEGPRIYLKERITSTKVIDANLPSSVVAYRGMSIDELNSNVLGMSWTLCQKKAEEFAFTVYSDKPRGVAVRSVIPRDRGMGSNGTEKSDKPHSLS